jgi:hypothetical protein
MIRSLTAIALFLTASVPALGQGTTAALDRGFAATAPAVATAEELAQGDLWVMQVDFKPMRLMRVQTTDPDTGRRREEVVWYMIYRAVNRPLKSPAQENDKTPVNNYDPPPGPPLFIPEFTLVTEGKEVQRVYGDVILPDAEAVIASREMRGADQANVLKNSVEAVQPIPSAEDQNARPIYGVAIWRGVDPTTDHFKVYASGFSNGYRQVTGPDGRPLILRREIVLDYWRPGDEFSTDEREFRFQSPPRWVYRAEEADPSDPGQELLTSVPAAGR